MLTETARFGLSSAQTTSAPRRSVAEMIGETPQLAAPAIVTAVHRSMDQTTEAAADPTAAKYRVRGER